MSYQDIIIPVISVALGLLLRKFWINKQPETARPRHHKAVLFIGFCACVLLVWIGVDQLSSPKSSGHPVHLILIATIFALIFLSSWFRSKKPEKAG
jgi:peptidoglycan/LPS O-acetylase OafA/YrhL